MAGLLTPEILSRLFALADIASAVPGSNPGDGKPWVDTSGLLRVGAGAGGTVPYIPSPTPADGTFVAFDGLGGLREAPYVPLNTYRPAVADYMVFGGNNFSPPPNSISFGGGHLVLTAGNNSGRFKGVTGSLVAAWSSSPDTNSFQALKYGVGTIGGPQGWLAPITGGVAVQNAGGTSLGTLQAATFTGGNFGYGIPAMFNADLAQQSCKLWAGTAVRFAVSPTQINCVVPVQAAEVANANAALTLGNATHGVTVPGTLFLTQPSGQSLRFQRLGNTFNIGINASGSLVVEDYAASPALVLTFTSGGGATFSSTVNAPTFTNGTTGVTTLGNATHGVTVPGPLTGTHVQNLGVDDTVRFKDLSVWRQFGLSTLTVQGLFRCSGNTGGSAMLLSEIKGINSSGNQQGLRVAAGSGNNGTGYIASFESWDGLNALKIRSDGTLELGGKTSAFPAIKRNGATINFRLADNSADAPITAGAATFSGGVSTGNLNVNQIRRSNAADHYIELAGSGLTTLAHPNNFSGDIARFLGGSNVPIVIGNGAASQTVRLAGNNVLGWTASSTNASGVLTSGIVQSAASEIELNNGTKVSLGGSYAGLKAGAATFSGSVTIPTELIMKRADGSSQGIITQVNTTDTRIRPVGGGVLLFAASTGDIFTVGQGGVSFRKTLALTGLEGENAISWSNIPATASASTNRYLIQPSGANLQFGVRGGFEFWVGGGAGGSTGFKALEIASTGSATFSGALTAASLESQADLTLAGRIIGPTSIQTRTAVADPTVSDIPAGDHSLWNNTLTGQTFVAANEAGTIKRSLPLTSTPKQTFNITNGTTLNTLSLNTATPEDVANLVYTLIEALREQGVVL